MKATRLNNENRQRVWGQVKFGFSGNRDCLSRSGGASAQNTGQTDQLEDQEKRWEDDINEFLIQIEEETENLTESSNQIDKNWSNTAKDRGRWTLLEENYTTNSKGRHENNTRKRRNSHNIPARYGNGVKLSDEELADIT